MGIKKFEALTAPASWLLTYDTCGIERVITLNYPVMGLVKNADPGGKTQAADPMLCQCWSYVCDAGLTFIHHCDTLWCSVDRGRSPWVSWLWVRACLAGPVGSLINLYTVLTVSHQMLYVRSPNPLQLLLMQKKQSLYTDQQSIIIRNSWCL